MLAFVVYKIEKNKGSEDGTGYETAKRLFEKYQENLVIFTRLNNVSKLKRDPDFLGCNIEGIEIPYLFRFYKKKNRGIILYYYLWQFFVSKAVNRYFSDKKKYLTVWNFNFHADWAPHFFRKNRVIKKIVWGPVGHHPLMPGYFSSSFVNILGDRIKYFFKTMFWVFDPNLKKAIKSSDIIFYWNNDIAPPFLAKKSKIYTIPLANSSLSKVEFPRFEKSKRFTVLFVGRPIDLKGIKLFFQAINDAFVAKDQFKVKLVGSNKFHKYSRRFCSAELMSKIEIVEWVPQPNLETIYVQSDCFLYPSLESQGLVVAEALSLGLQTITVAKSGPSFVSRGHSLDVEFSVDHQVMVKRMSDQLRVCYREWLLMDRVEYSEEREKLVREFRSAANWDKTVDDLVKVII